jgi:hypothetical protein
VDGRSTEKTNELTDRKMNYSNKLLNTIALVILLPGWFLSPSVSVKAAAEPTCPIESGKAIQFSVDGTDVKMCSNFLSDPNFTAPDPTDALQVASSFDPTDLQREFSISAIPAGTRSGAEVFPTIHPALGDTFYQVYLWFTRLTRGEKPKFGPPLTLFGKSVSSVVSQVDVSADPTHPEYSTLSEWVTLAGDRLWIVRMSQKSAGSKGLSASVVDPSGTQIWSDDLNKPSSSKTAAGEVPKSVTPQDQASSAGELATPTWWNGVCDTNHYFSNLGQSAFPLGAVYRGLLACGPRPIAVGGKDVKVQFFKDSWGELEWQCVELSMRFMYLNYGIQPYQANGNQVVPNYITSKTNPVKILKVVNNGTHGTAPRPGDVLSYGAATPYGHTSVVTTSYVDGSGNGSITVIEQNNSSSGQANLSVKNWVVLSSMTVSGWLTPIIAPPSHWVYLPSVSK